MSVEKIPHDEEYCECGLNEASLKHAMEILECQWIKTSKYSEIYREARKSWSTWCCLHGIPEWFKNKK